MQVSHQFHAPNILSLPGNEYSVPTGKEVEWAPQLLWEVWRREISIHPARNQNMFLWSPIHSLHTVTMKLVESCCL